jgi:hypothetical protein
MKELDVILTSIAEDAQLVAMTLVFNRAIATRYPFGIQHSARISTCITVINSFIEEWE